MNIETQLKLLALEIRKHGRTIAIKYESFDDGYTVTHYAVEYDDGYYLLMYRDVRIKGVLKCDDRETLNIILEEWKHGNN